MNITKLFFLQKRMADWRRLISKCLLLLVCLLMFSIQPAYAGINDDNYDGNMFVVYAGNGSLVPPRQTLAQTLTEHKPAFLAFYVDDSSDCKKYAIVISRVQEFYGRVAEIIPIDVDTIPVKEKYDPTEPGYYYSGGVPQVVVFNQSGQVLLNKKGQVPFEEIDDKFREVFDLLPRAESVQLKRRSFNEFSSELAK
ncbi:thylakoid membrane photosystem I accumulation factor [Nostoc sp. FACHB-87]|uniref:thylakoid membrane photosystem I accumulation factor n=1 Tax=Nostocales TaxID=1161 RepID=UPI001682C32C|nr:MULTISPECIES: thylakoid membrane photosystem I accumulation factor [Nostocales]MBD2301289.1 thylakoid membrane photosystem I accumulation factor [Nostoc sp. FACHB-190]MBD2457753.1 thylakoid membrane photosystem I accumulation factor [Nostoc sp. FACHB-87]MBD2478213.1 thylakoid membrane photosystem I accumulation factor [Anabaena sp. FACHB-83]MBD2486832.1 thylakoid membrane photosystem I accumulation factor [Aulosira sp. FACHB-615]